MTRLKVSLGARAAQLSSTESTAGRPAKSPGLNPVCISISIAPHQINACLWKKAPAGLSAGFPKRRGAEAQQALGGWGAGGGGTASQNPARGGPWTPPAQLRTVTPEQPQKVRAAPPRQQGQQQP